MKKITKKITVSAIAAGVAATAFSTTASAAANEDRETEATINGGSLSIEDLNVNSFAETTLDGTVQTLTTDIGDYTVVDSTGSGSGWQLNVNAGALTTGEDGFSLPANSLSLDGHTVSADEGSSSSDTVGTGGGAIDTGDDTGINVLSADADGGMGTFTIADTDLSLVLQPKDVKAGTYTSTVNFSLVSGPSS